MTPQQGLGYASGRGLAHCVSGGQNAWRSPPLIASRRSAGSQSQIKGECDDRCVGDSGFSPSYCFSGEAHLETPKPLPYDIG